MKNQNEVSEVINFFHGVAEKVTLQNLEEIDQAISDGLYVHCEIDFMDVIVHTMTFEERKSY